MPVGILWRQVYEATGGGWTRQGSAWVSDVFAYHLSLACNHCARPICVEICPAQAITQRADGVVLIDDERCLGCQYCSWACPYNAPQYDLVAGRMRKCDLCIDELDQGRKPVCVTACPLRALELITDHSPDGNDGSAIFPLPDPSLTVPAISIKPHARALRAEADAVKLDGLGLAVPQEGHDFSLVAFTILSQMAVGALCILCLLHLWVDSSALSDRIAFAVVASMALALLASLFHLGSPENAWRALANWSYSWISREILFGLLFTLASGVLALELSGANGYSLAWWLALLPGLALIYSMANAYSLRTVPAWRTPFTLLSFVLTTLLLGTSSVAATAAWVDLAGGWTTFFVPILLGLVIAEWTVLWLWLAQLKHGSEASKRASERITRDFQSVVVTRWVFSLSGIIAAGASLFSLNDRIAFAFGFVLLLCSEVIGRSLFYRMRIHEGI